MLHITRLDTRTGKRSPAFVALRVPFLEHPMNEDTHFYVGANRINHSPVLPC